MHLIISILYFFISLFFVKNLKTIYARIKQKKTANICGLLATSSLVFQFLALAVYFLADTHWIVILAQVYMIICIIFLLTKKN